MDKQVAWKVFRGVMLGDAGLYSSGSPRYTYFNMGLSGGNLNTLMNYLTHIKDALSSLGIAISEDFPKVMGGTSKGKCYDYCSLKTRCSPVLAEEWPKWYLKKKQLVPPDIQLDPVTIAHWFMGDGSSQYGASGCVYTIFATHNFLESSILILESQLHNLGLNTCRGYDKRIKNGDGILIMLPQDSVNRFMDMVKPHMLEPYLYKLKYRELPAREYVQRGPYSRRWH